MELVVALAIAVVLAWLLFHVLAQALLAARTQSAADLEQSTVGRLVDTLTTEEDDAWAIYTPPTDVLGKSNSDGHEVDFFARDGQRRPYFWAYSYDAPTQTLTRYRFASPGGAATVDTTFTGITKFHTQTYPVTALQDASTPIYSTLYNGATLQSGTVHFYPSMPWIAGGNNITYLHIESATIKQDLQLVTQTAPSGFTVVVYYTPSPSPEPTAAPAAFKTWPAQLVVGQSGLAVGTSSGTLANMPPRQWIARTLNGVLGGGVAMAAAGASCTAEALSSSGSIDNTLDGYPSIEAAYGIYVDSNGCEVNASGAPLSQPEIVAYEPSGNAGNFHDQPTCTLTSFGWMTSSWGSSAVLGALPGSQGESCSVAFSDGYSTQTPSPDAGTVGVEVLPALVEKGGPTGTGNGCFQYRTGIDVTYVCNGNASVSLTGYTGCSASASGTYTDVGESPAKVVKQSIIVNPLPSGSSAWSMELQNALASTEDSVNGAFSWSVPPTVTTTGCP